MPADHEEFVRGLAQRNERWVNGTRTLSPRLITSLLRWSGEQLDTYLGTVDLAGPSSVYWAGEVPVQLSGDPALAEPLLRVRGIIV